MTDSVVDPNVGDEPGSVLHRHPKSREFVQIENSTIRDGRLSFKASGLLAHLLSLPQGSKTGSVELAKGRPDGRTAIQAAYRELRDLGYVTQERKQMGGGQWKTYTHVYEVPPNAGNLPSVPDAGSPASVNLPVSLRDKDKEMKDGPRQFRCSACGRDDLESMDELLDHQENECPELRDQDGSFETAREALRKSGGRGSIQEPSDA